MVNRVKMLEEELRGMAMRADVAEAERDEALARTEKDGAVISTLQGDFLRVERERDEWKARAEAAEARTASAVSRADIEKCVYGSRRAGRECDEQGFVPVHVQEAVEQLCDLFGIEAEQAADPVEEKAEELMRVLAPETEDRTWGILTEPAREDFRRLARHVLGQEASYGVDC